jgi:hypothetical protein
MRSALDTLRPKYPQIIFFGCAAAHLLDMLSADLQKSVFKQLLDDATFLLVFVTSHGRIKEEHDTVAASWSLLVRDNTDPLYAMCNDEAWEGVSKSVGDDRPEGFFQEQETTHQTPSAVPRIWGMRTIVECRCPQGILWRHLSAEATSVRYLQEILLFIMRGGEDPNRADDVS